MPPRPGKPPGSPAGGLPKTGGMLGAFAGAFTGASALTHLRLQRREFVRTRHRHAPRHSAAKAEHRCHLAHRAALGAAHLLHHIGNLPMLLQQAIDILDLGAGARCDALLARGFENIGIAPLRGVIERMIARWRLKMRSSRLAEAI